MEEVTEATMVRRVMAEVAVAIAEDRTAHQVPEVVTPLAEAAIPVAADTREAEAIPAAVGTLAEVVIGRSRKAS